MARDVLAFGEALLRLQPVDDGRLEENGLLAAYVGGAELNTCHALAGLGVSVSWFSVLPEGPLGRRILITNTLKPAKASKISARARNTS